MKPEEIAFEHPCVFVEVNMVRRTKSRNCNDRGGGCKRRNQWFGLLALVLPAALAACAPKTAEPASDPVMAGGWQAADTRDERVRAAAEYAAAHLPEPHGALAEVTSAETQIVAGTNLRMCFGMSDGTRWTATVWHRLDGSFELTGARQLP